MPGVFSWARGFQSFALDLASHGLATEQAFKFAATVQGNDLLIGPDGCARCPVELGASPWGSSLMI